MHNKSDRPLLLIGGELLLGGKQDRIVVHDVIIPPGKTEDVEVDCVEHGRWEGTSQHFDFSSKMVPRKVREAAAYEGQQQVWDNVAGYNADAAPAATGTTIQMGLNSPEVEKGVKENLPTLAKVLDDNPRAVGVIYVLNGEIVSMDIYGNPKTFQASKEGLLHSYLAEGAVTKSESKKQPTSDDFKKFMTEALNGKRQADPARDVYFTTAGASKGKILMKGGEDGALIHGSFSNMPNDK